MIHFVSSAIRKVVISTMILLVVFVFACKKGDTGPAGPQGSTGTANVIYSDWFSPSTWTMTTVLGIKHFDYTRPTPAITQGIIDSGVVLTYGKMVGYNPQVWPA